MLYALVTEKKKYLARRFFYSSPPTVDPVASVDSDHEVLEDELANRQEQSVEQEDQNSIAGKRENTLGKRGRSTRTTKGLKKRQYSPSIKGKKVIKRRKKVTFSPMVDKVNAESDSDSVQESLNELVAAAASKFTSGEGTLQDTNDLVTQSCQLASHRRNTAKLLEPPQTSDLLPSSTQTHSSPSTPAPPTLSSSFTSPNHSSIAASRSCLLYTSDAADE